MPHSALAQRHVLLAYYDSRDPSCPSRLLSEDDAAGGIGFPYPFAHQTQAWYGVWWEDVLIAGEAATAMCEGAADPIRLQALPLPSCGASGWRSNLIKICRYCRPPCG